MIAPLLPVLMLITATGSAIGLLRPPVPLPALVFRNGWPNQACSVQTPARCSAVAAAPAFSIGIMQSCAGIAQSCVGITLSCAGITQSCAGLVQQSLLPSLKAVTSTTAAARSVTAGAARTVFSAVSTSVTGGSLLRRLRLGAPRLMIGAIFLWTIWLVIRRQAASRRSMDTQSETSDINAVGMTVERDVRARRYDNRASRPRDPFPWVSGQQQDTAKTPDNEPAVALWDAVEAIAGATADAAAQSAALAFTFITETIDASANDEVQLTLPLPPAELASTPASPTDLISNGKVVPTAKKTAVGETTVGKTTVRKATSQPKPTKLPKPSNKWLFP